MKKFISILISICMLYSFATISFADYTSDVIISAPAESFNVTVPTQLPVSFDKEGTATYATDAAIVNNSSSPVKVSAITIAPAKGWTREAGTFTNTRQFDMTVSMASSGPIGANSSQYINYSVRLPKQKTALSNAKIATVIFTIGWADSGNDLPYAIAVNKYYDSNTKANWLSVANYGDYTLLVIEDPSEYLVTPAFPDCVSNDNAANYCKPVPSTPSSPFDLSKDEYLSYCVGLPGVGEFNLRETGTSVNYQGIIDESRDSIIHRSAVWILSSSLPSTTS